MVSAHQPLRRGRLLAASGGLFLLVLSVYALAGPGRIDIIDGQYRFEVAHNLLESRSLQVRDPFLLGAAQGIGGRYSPYGISASILAIPLLIVADQTGRPSIDRQQFFFSFASAVFGAGTAALLFLFYLRIGVTLRNAFGWTLVAAFATLAFPAATTVFDQTQHGFFILAASLLVFLGARRQSLALTIAGGLALAVLVNFQESYAILFPALALAAFAPPDADVTQRRSAVLRAVVFMAVGGLGLVAWAGLNYVRYGVILFSGKGTNHPAVFGNPLVGLGALLVSPGKSIFLYSPSIALALFGVRELLRREGWLGLSIVAASVAHIGLISCLTFFGGDWCWGPRYFVPILPLLALGLPLATRNVAVKPLAVQTVVGISLVVQLMAISLDHHRFFYGHSLLPFFWADRPEFYFEHSALAERPAELVTSLRKGIPREATVFRPGPYPDLVTYAVFGPPFDEPSMPRWMRQYRVFWLPRPWPLWMMDLPYDRRPANARTAAGGFLAMAVVGLCALGYANVTAIEARS